MECSKCGKNKAVINLRYMDEQYCRNCFTQLYEQRVRKTLREHDMIDRENRIALAVSGGKDSLAMAHILNKLYEDTVLLTIDEGIEGYREKSIEKVKEFASKRDLDTHIYSIEEEYGSSIDEITREKDEEDACSYCGVFRRQLLNKKARELKCDKIATGHNLDDEAQTIMMNIIRGEPRRLARMGPVTGFKDHDKFVPRIKPIRKCSEKENTVYSMVQGIEFEEETCPYAYSQYRELSRDFLNDLERQQPGAKFSILASYDKILPALRKHNREGSGEIKECSRCGEPTSKKTCKACKMKKKLNR